MNDTNIDNAVEALDSLSLQDYLEVVRRTADARFKATKNVTTRASYFYDISTLAGRYARILKG